MKVLIVQPSMGFYGGAERVIVELANYLTAHHNPTTILTTRTSDGVRDALDDARIVFAKDFDDLNAKLKHIYKDFDVINPHNHPSQIMCHGVERPVVWMCNEPSDEYFATGKVTGSDLLAVENNIDGVIVADEFNWRRFEGIYGREPSAIIPYGISADFFRNGNGRWVRAKLEIEDKFVIVHTGFVHPQKNQKATVDALIEVRKKIPNAVVVLSGMQNAEYSLQLAKYAKENGVGDALYFMPFTNRNDVRDLYHAADVIVHPIHSQGGWLSVFDSICTGKPVLVSDEFTGASILKEHDLAVVLDNSKLADGIMSVVESLDTDKNAERRFQWIRDNLTWEKYCEKTLEVFEKWQTH